MIEKYTAMAMIAKMTAVVSAVARVARQKPLQVSSR